MHAYMLWQVAALLKIVRMMKAVHNKVALIEVADFACTLAFCRVAHILIDSDY